MNATASKPLHTATAFDPIEAAIITFGGYTQAAGPSVGLGYLHERIEQWYHDRRRHYVGLRAWNDDHATTAAWIERKQPQMIVAIGYSYGCGHALVKFAGHLAELGRSIDIAYLLDPVPRFRVLKPISLGRWGKYNVPANVRETHYWRQVNGSPYGRVPVHPDGKPIICEGVFGSAWNLQRHADGQLEPASTWRIDSASDHSTIDNNWAIHAHILNHIAGRLDREA